MLHEEAIMLHMDDQMSESLYLQLYKKRRGVFPKFYYHP